MEKIQFKTTINATPDKIWDALWSDEGYRDWTSYFSEGSHAVTDWKKGSKVLFMDGKNTGMVSTVVDHVPNEFMSFKHLGMVENGKENMDGEELKGWQGALENYTLKKSGQGAELTVDMDITEEHKAHFEDVFPKALDKVKSRAENN